MKVLKYRADLRSVISIVLLQSLFFALWIGWIPLQSPLGWISWAVTFPLAFIACIINHNHQHLSTFSTKACNKIWGIFLSLSIGQPAVAIVPMHNYNHHVHNGDDRDFVRPSLVRFRWNFLNLILFPFISLWGFIKEKTEILGEWKRSDPKRFRQLVYERWVFYPVLLTLFILQPVPTLLFYLCPYLFGQWAIIAVNFIQHDGCDPHSKLNNSRNFTGSVLNFFVLNNGFHTAHHLYPGLHWSLLPEKHKSLQAKIHPSLSHSGMIKTLLEFYIWPARRPLWQSGGKEQ